MGRSWAIAFPPASMLAMMANIETILRDI